MSQASVARPFAVAQLRHELRCHPMRAPGCGPRDLRRWRRPAGEAIEAPAQRAECLLVESGPHRAGKAQPMRAIVVSEQKRAEAFAGTPGVGPADDHEVVACLA